MEDLFKRLGNTLNPENEICDEEVRRLRKEKTILLDKVKRDIDKIYNLETQIENMRNCGNCEYTGYHRPVNCELCKKYKYGNTEDHWELKHVLKEEAIDEQR